MKTYPIKENAHIYSPIYNNHAELNNLPGIDVMKYIPTNTTTNLRILTNGVIIKCFCLTII